MKIFVFGDSYANFRRFDAGIERAFGSRGLQASVVSHAFPGYHSGKLLKALQGPRADIMRADLGGRADLAFVLAGVNDFVQHRGAEAYARNLVRLVAQLGQYADRVAALELPRFDERAELSGAAGRAKHLAFRLMFDLGGTIQSYRDAARMSVAGRADLVDPDGFLPTYDPARFKDGIHLTDEQFSGLADYAGERLAQLNASRAITRTQHRGRVTAGPG